MSELGRRGFLQATGRIAVAGLLGCGDDAPASDAASPDDANPDDAAASDARPDAASTVPEGIVFHSDWSTALGSTAAAVRDTSKTLPWELVIGGTSALSVIAATGLDFPTTNCLQVDCVYNGSDVQEFNTGEVSLLPGSGAWPVPAAGEALYFRLYKRLVYPHSTTNNPPPAGNNNHCVEERSGGGTNWSWTFRTNAAGWTPLFNTWVGGAATRFTLGGSSPISLSRDLTYRLEWSVHRLAGDMRRHEVRIYDAAGTLLYTEADFALEFGGTTTLAQHTAALSHLQLDALQLGTNGMGFNDPNEPTQDVRPAWYFAGVAVSNVTWCGAYRSGL